MTTASIVLYNNPEEEIVKLLDSIHTGSVDKVFIIDHSDTDILKSVVARYDRTFYYKQINKGFGAGHNKGLEFALELKPEFHAFINPDIYWEGDVIGELESFMNNNPQCGLVMPKILFPNGDIQYLCKLLPTPFDLFVRRFLPFKSYKERLNARYEMRSSGYDKIMEIPCLSGCFMFVRTSVLKEAGNFDERFFLYAEDMDLCRRIGMVSQTIFNPNITVYHTFHRASYRSVKYLGLHTRSVIKYFNKWGWIFDSYRNRCNKRCISGI